jgi:hypothetical protein
VGLICQSLVVESIVLGELATAERFAVAESAIDALRGCPRRFRFICYARTRVTGERA